MAISLNEITQHSGDALDQIRTYPINWILASIAIVVVGCWLLAEFIEFFEDRKRIRQRFARRLV
jgi:hypothetical protein